jgi:hypothetical protein
MMRVCPICREVLSPEQEHCSKCGSALAAAEKRSLMQKLECALSHSEPQTAMRAAEILARRFDSSEAVPVLIRALEQRWREPHAVAAILRVVGRFGGRLVHDVLISALGHESAIVRAPAAEWLQVRACLRQQRSKFSH